jgi:hypothetical protein
LQNQLAPYESTIPANTTAFDTTTDFPDVSGFDIPLPTPQTPITGNTGGNMATSYTEDPYADYISEPRYDYSRYDEMNDPATMLQDTTPYNFTPEEQQLIYQLAQEQGYDDPTGGAGGLGTNQNPAMYGNLTVGQLQRLLSGTAGGAGARPLTTAQRTAQQQALGSLLGGAVSGVGGILAGQTAAKASE